MGLSQIELGRRVGIKSSSMSNIESGKTKCPSGTALMRIAAVLDLSPEWIVHGKGEKQLSELNVSNDQIGQIAQQLNRSNQAALLAAAQAMLESQIE